MNEMINSIGLRMVIKMRIVNRVVESGEFKGRMRQHPIYSEFVGMQQLLKAMDIDHEIDYDESVTLMTAITIMGKRFEV